MVPRNSGGNGRGGAVTSCRVLETGVSNGPEELQLPGSGADGLSQVQTSVSTSTCIRQGGMQKRARRRERSGAEARVEAETERRQALLIPSVSVSSDD